jgi:hypothetical protein
MSERLRGLVERRDLEGGIFQLVGDDGSRTTLIGRRDELLAAVGQRVEVEGRLDEGGFGLAMSGPQLHVARLHRL